MEQLRKKAKEAITLAKIANERASRYEYGYYHPIYNLMHPEETEGKIHTEFTDKNGKSLYLGDKVKYFLQSAGDEGIGTVGFSCGALGLLTEEAFYTFFELSESKKQQLLCVERI